MISVILPTLRVGGLDVVFQSLARQTYRDFELIVADGIGEHRYLQTFGSPGHSDYTFPWRWLGFDRQKGAPLTNYCRAINDALVEARGEVVLLLPDYAWLMDDCLETHARWHEEHRGERKALMAEYTLTGLPPLHPSFKPYHPTIAFDLHDPDAHFEAAMTAEADRYEADLKAGKLDAVMWSLFAEPLTYEAMLELPIVHTHHLWEAPDGMGNIVPVEWTANHCSLKNESFPIELFEDLNGLDEDLDGSHLFQDWAFAQRMERHGWGWERTRGGTIRIPDPRPVLTCKRALRPMRTNQTIAEQKLAGAPVNPGWSLRERRAAR